MYVKEERSCIALFFVWFMMPLVGPSLSTILFTSSTPPAFVALPSPSPLIVRRRRRGTFPRRNASIEPPPLGYDFRAETRQDTAAIIRQLYPDLSDLVEEGNMVVIQRPLDYVERRTDGYVEPELIILFGTSHVSNDSAANVERVLRAVRPENVVVELCRSRAGIMYSGKPDKPVQGQPAENKETNLFSIGGGSFLSAMGRSLNLGGQSALALRLLLAGFSKNISSSIGTPIGDEFRVARKASVEVGAQIVLGDRPIEITLERAWKALRWTEQLGFIKTLIQGTFFRPLDVSKGNLEKLNTDDSLSTMFKELSMFYPSLLQPLIHERDVYLAWSLKRSKAVNGSKKVVGIIGRGHMRGVVHALKHDQNHLRFRDLVGGRRPKNDNMKDWKLNTYDSLSTMFKELSMFYPSLLQPLIHERDERDVYLAWSLKRSKAVNGCKKVVGIIGRGHMRGVVHALKHDQNHLRFRDLVGGRRPKNDNMKDWVRSIVKSFIRDTIITIIVLWFVEHQNIKFGL